MSKQKGKPEPIAAVAYCRKSTNEERAEKSIADQRARIGKLKPLEEGTTYSVVRWYVRDKGVPGWKRGASRPDYFKLVGELKDTGAKAILVDDMDRFSRADEMETVADVQHLRELGVDVIHAVNQGSRDLHQEGAVHIIAAQANASHAHSTRLSRRVAEARKDAALQGKRSGGEAPYGLANDGKGGLKHGDPKQIRTVRWVFDQFANCCTSMNHIAGELNRKKVPARKGGKWYVATVKNLLRERAYRGDFVYNEKKSGQFHIINGKHEVEKVSRYADRQRKAWKATSEGLIVHKGVYKPLVDPKLFDKAQKRLARFSLKGSRRPRADGYPLSGILICTECNKPMYGCTHRGRRVYRCSSNAKSGPGSCGYFWVAEEEILPRVLKELWAGVEGLRASLISPPEELRRPQKRKAEERRAIQRQLDKLVKDLKVATRNVGLASDSRIRRDLTGMLVGMHNEKDGLEAQLADEPDGSKYSREQLDALNQWWDEFTSRAVSTAVEGGIPVAAHLFADHESEEGRVLIDTQVLNDALHRLGARVEMYWTTRQVTLSNGKRQRRYGWERGRLTLGNRSVTLYKTPPAAACNGNSEASRRDSRTGKGLARRST